VFITVLIIGESGGEGKRPLRYPDGGCCACVSE
jgi:hypothetical protein